MTSNPFEFERQSVERGWRDGLEGDLGDVPLPVTWLRHESATAGGTDAIQLQDLRQATHVVADEDLDKAASTTALPSQPAAQPLTSTIYSSVPLGDSATAIRVLQVEAPQADSPSTICCRLRKIDLEDDTTFSALSYVWGDPTDQQTIWCNSIPFQVTKNAAEALQRLRNKFAPLTIWIDAICINQIDEIEKARQIRLMRRIYSSASPVYVWLGEGNDITDRAMRFLASGALVDRSLPDSEAIVFDRDNRRRILFHMVARQFSRRAQHTLYRGLEELFGRPWIERLWTMQEILVASSPEIVCGTSVVPWSKSLGAAEIFDILRSKEARLGFVPYPLPSLIEPWLQLTTIWRGLHGLEQSPHRPSGDSTEPSRYIHARYLSLRMQWWIGMAVLAGLAVSSIILTLYLVLLVAIPAAPWSTFGAVLGVGMGCLLGLLAFIVKFLDFPDRLWESHATIPRKTSLMRQIATRQCTVKEDYYYGVLGITQSRHSENRSDIVVPQAQSGNAYLSLCLNLVRWFESLDFLLFLSAERDFSGPLWVVQWHNADNLWCTYPYRFDLHYGYKASDNVPNVNRNATPGSEPYFTFVRGELTVRASFYSEIALLSVADSEGTLSSRRSRMRRRVKQLIAGGYADGLPHTAKYAVEHNRAAFRIPPSHRYAYPAFGMGPRETRVGDRVALISGVSMPVVLRFWPGRSRYIMIGPCYILNLGDTGWTQEAQENLQEIILV